jgi:hypothetical protein|tara:strand:- start:577 stop:753 length:177 start_codon:yes stop_codon:yes gene_type:complete
MKHYKVYIKETITKAYHVNAKSEEEARDTYLTEGINFPLSNTTKDREVITVEVESSNE